MLVISYPVRASPNLFNALPGVAMSGGAADSALGSLFAAYGDTTDDEDIDLVFSEAFIHWYATAFVTA